MSHSSSDSVSSQTITQPTSEAGPDSRLATLIGASAVLLWGSLALLTSLTGGRIPPFQMMSVSFGIAFVLMAIRWWLRGESGLAYARQPREAWLLGIAGYFGYHACYFAAMSKAPAVEVSLIAYLWPLLMVLMSTLVTGMALHWNQIAGALTALLGCWILLVDGDSGFGSQYLDGYLLALVCAFVWSGFSVLSRTMKAVPTDAAGWFCGATAFLGCICHLLFETTVWPESLLQWLALIGLGVGPVGIAFFTWDYGTKHGNLVLLGVLSYAAPLVSVLLLLLAGKGEWRLSIGVATIAIVIGAWMASLIADKKTAAPMERPKQP